MSARWSTAPAARGKSLSVLVIDIDHFKTINDTYGHDVGDEVLREFAVRLRACIRGIDLACRYGGEEFVVVMPDTDLGVAARVAERIRRRSPATVPDRARRALDRGHDLDRHRRAPRARTMTRADAPEARRRGALSRQARRPQPRRRRRGVSALSASINLKSFSFQAARKVPAAGS